MNLGTPERCLMKTLLSIGLFLFASNAHGQQTWVVDALGGPGSDFTTLGAAILAASDGDTLYVRDGTYAEAVVLDKGLRIHGDFYVQSLAVQGLASGQDATVAGLKLLQDGDAELADNLGRVWLQNLSGDSTDLGNSLVVRNCSNVEVSGLGFVFGGFVSLEGSRVALHDANLHGVGDDVNCGPGQLALSVAAGSELFLVSSFVSGGSGAFSPWCGAGSPAGDGIHVTGASHVTAINTQIAGGSRPNGPNGARSVVDGTSSLTEVSSPLISSSGSFQVRTLGKEGESFPISVFAQAGTNVVLRYSASPGTLLTFPGVLGPLALRTPLQMISLGAVPSGGLNTQFVAPQLPPGLLSRTFYVQPVLFQGANRLLGRPYAITLLDASL